MPAAASTRLRPLLLLLLLLLAARAGAGAVGVGGGGQLWCVAKNNAEDGALQSAIDWACGPDGGADCHAIQQGGACYDPPDLQAHASYAFNDYFLRAGGAANPAACNFSGAAALTALNPSHGSCVFQSSVHPQKMAASQEQQPMVQPLQI
ncbi:hypothetical protein ACP4OV_013011 [Aristida adscensionis]